MPSPVRLLIVAVIAVGLALALATVLRDPGSVPSDTSGSGPIGSTDRTPSGRTPSFHLGLTEDQAIHSARLCLDRLTTGQANELGPIKDDLALLCVWPKVREMILVDCEQRSRVSRHEGTAFAAVFKRVRAPEFVAPLKSLFEHHEMSVRLIAAQAAATQSDPELGPALLALYRDFAAAHPNSGSASREVMLDSMVRCGGDLLPVLLSEMLRDSHVAIRSGAATVIGKQGLRGLRGELKRVLSLELDPLARVLMNIALARLGDRDGIAEVLNGIDRRNKDHAPYILEAVRTIPLPAARAKLLELHDAQDPAFGRLVGIALEELGFADRILESEPADRDSLAFDVYLVTRAYRSDPSDLAYLGRFIDSVPSSPNLSAVLWGLTLAAPDSDPALARKIFDSEIFTNPRDYGPWAKRLGPDMVPDLVARVRASGKVNDIQHWLEFLSLIPSPLARKGLVSLRDDCPVEPSEAIQFGKLIDIRIRTFDLEALRLRGVAGIGH